MSFLKRLRRDRRGVSAIEFALIAPVMILIYFGLAELTMAMMAQRRASHVASAVGDLVTQGNGATTAAEITDIFTVADAIIAPFPKAPLSIRLTSIKADATGVTKVVWSSVKGTGFSKLPVGNITIPTGLIAANESIVQAEAQYIYTGSVKYVVKQGFTFNDKFYLRPRKADQITCPDC